MSHLILPKRFRTPKPRSYRRFADELLESSRLTLVTLSPEQVYDTLRGRGAIIVPGTNASASYASPGRGIRGAASTKSDLPGTNYTADSRWRLGTSEPVTLFGRFWLDSTGSYTQLFAYPGYTGEWAAFARSNVLRFYRGGSNYETAHTSTTTGKWQTFAMSHDGSTARILFDHRISEGAFTGTTANPFPGDNWNIAGVTSYAFTGFMDFAGAIYGDAWTAEEMLRFNRDPHALLWQPPRTRSYFFPASAGGTTITVADGSHGHTADNVALTQAHTLALADSSHSHTADNVDLTQASTLVIADSSHTHSTDNVDLTTANTLVVADSSHTHSTDNVDLTQASTLVAADSSHAHSTDNVVLSTADTLAVADSSHAHTTDNVALTQAHTLVVADSAHAHSTDNVDLTQASTLVVADSSHAHTADNTTLDFSAILVVADSSHSHTTDNVDLTQASTLVVADSSHTHSADNISLSEATTLTVADATHAHSVDNVVTSFEALLAVDDASHSHITYSLDLVQAHLLAVNDATHVHRADRLFLAVAGATYWMCFDILDASTSFDVTDASTSFDATTICGS